MVKIAKKKKYSNWFQPVEQIKPNFSTRSEKYPTKLTYTPVSFRKTRYKKSPIPYLIQILNDQYAKKKK